MKQEANPVHGQKSTWDSPKTNATQAGFNRYQRQQFARLYRAYRWIYSRAERSLDRGDPLYRVYRRLRRGLIAVLRAALFAAGDKRAGGYRWAELLEHAGAQLPATPAVHEALEKISAMPYRPEEAPTPTTGEAARRYLATLRPYQSAARALQQWPAQIAAPAVGIREGRWLQLKGQPCLLLR